MELFTEILVRVGGLAVFGVVFVAFVYWVTQIQPRHAERKAASEKDAEL